MLEQQSFPFGKTKRKSPEAIRRLSLREVFLLASLVLTEYTLSGKDDPAFATWASEKLGIPGINRNHIATSREIRTYLFALAILRGDWK